MCNLAVLGELVLNGLAVMDDKLKQEHWYRLESCCLMNYYHHHPAAGLSIWSDLIVV